MRQHNEKTYLFYDIETTGLNKAFDQVLQFAAIRTDLNLNELERHEIKIKLNPDMIPSPAALITHQISLKEMAAGIDEYTAIQQIHRHLNKPGTISLGYNTLGFDDEFLRFSFYRNLLPPYTHQYANQCCRMDLYPMTILYFLYKNSVLTWPKLDGKISLKLEYLNAANHFAQGQAHHAMVDVEVTLELARCFFKEEAMWKFTTDLFNKEIDLKRSQDLTHNQGLMIYSKFGTHCAYQAPVLFLGPHRHYKNQTIWLRLDTLELNQTTENNISKTTYSIRKKLTEPGFILPLKERFTQSIENERLQLAKDNYHWLQQNPNLLKRITDYYCDYKYPTYPETDIEASLYLNGFWNDSEENFCRQFHAASPEKKYTLTSSLKNNKLRQLALRILGRHYPEVMSADQQQEFAAYLDKAVTPDTPLIDYKGEKRLTPLIAYQTSQTLRQDPLLSPEKIALLLDLEAYLGERFSVS